MGSKALKARKEPPEHRYLPKVVIVPVGDRHIQPACSCGWKGALNYRTNAKDAWEEHRYGARTA